jgi:hypothetical protein
MDRQYIEMKIMVAVADVLSHKPFVPMAAPMVYVMELALLPDLIPQHDTVRVMVLLYIEMKIMVAVADVLSHKPFVPMAAPMVYVMFVQQTTTLPMITAVITERVRESIQIVITVADEMTGVTSETPVLHEPAITLYHYDVLLVLLSQTTD